MNLEERLKKIRSKGYWRVVIRPTVFEKHRIATLSQARELVRSSVVYLRGWDYPHWGEDELRNVGEWVESGVDWNSFIEYWRFYRSGQFVHFFAAREDHIDVERQLPISYPPRPKRAGYLSTIGTVFTVTEIFEFAARLAAKDVLRPAAVVSIQLHNMADHQLATFDASRLLFGDYTCTATEPIVFENEFSQDELISRTDELALDAVVEIFEHFNWDNPPRQTFVEDQRRLRERRL